MLKLTLSGDGFIWITAAHIRAIVPQLGFTNIDIGGWNYSVKETPEEILAMPEMRAELDRAMLAITDKVPRWDQHGRRISDGKWGEGT